MPFSLYSAQFLSPNLKAANLMGVMCIYFVSVYMAEFNGGKEINYIDFFFIQDHHYLYKTQVSSLFFVTILVTLIVCVRVCPLSDVNDGKRRRKDVHMLI